MNAVVFEHVPLSEGISEQVHQSCPAALLIAGDKVMEQISFSDAEHSAKKKVTKREKFLAGVDPFPRTVRCS
jgi:hypothetical protein